MAINKLVSKPDGIDSTTIHMLHSKMITEDTTIYVPSQFPTIHDAMEWVESRVLLAYVTIQVADGTYTTTSGYQIQHQNYAMVRFRGNPSNPGNCMLDTGTDHVFSVYKGVLNAMYGFKFIGGGHGIMVAQGGIVHECRWIEMQGLSNNGLHVVNNSSMPYCTDINIHNISQTGLYSYSESYIQCQNTTSQNNSQYGAVVSTGSKIHLWGTTTMSGNGSGNYNVAINTIVAPYGDIIIVV